LMPRFFIMGTIKGLRRLKTFSVWSLWMVSASWNVCQMTQIIGRASTHVASLLCRRAPW
jgi:hypothetical protein